jgi:hypothetical protein
MCCMLVPQVSTLCVREDLVTAGGFGGELVVKRLGEDKPVYAGRITARWGGPGPGVLSVHGQA